MSIVSNRLILIVVFLFSLIRINYSQEIIWEGLSVPDFESFLEPPYIAFYGDEILMGASLGIYKSVDNGKTWKKVFVYPEDSTSKEIYVFSSIQINNQGYLFALGGVPYSTQQLFRSLDGGKHWELLLNNTEINPTSFYLSNNIVFISGYYGIAKSTDNGKTWTKISNGLNSIYLSQICGINETILFASDMYGIMKTVDGGINWRYIFLCSGPAKIKINSAGEIYISGGCGLYRSIDQGESWGRIKEEYTDAIAFDSENNIVISNFTQIQKSDRKLLEWKTYANVHGPTLAFDSNDFLYLLSNLPSGVKVVRGKLPDIINPPSGKMWHQQISGTTSNCHSISMIDSSNGFVLSDNGLLRTNSGGSCWLFDDIWGAINQEEGNLRDIVFTNMKTGWILADNYRITQGSFILKTTDSGQRWNGKYFPQIVWASDIFLIDSLNIWLSGWSPFLEQSVDGGDTWTIKNLGELGWTKIFFLNKHLGWIAKANSSNSKVYRTTDGGNNWDIINEGASGGINFIYFKDQYTGWKAGSELDTLNGVMSDFIKRTTDGGNSWEVQETRDFSSMCFSDLETAWLLNRSGIVYKSVDVGLSWVIQDSIRLSSNSSLNKIKFITKNIGWITGDSGRIYKTTNGGVTFVDDKKEVLNLKEFYLSQNYPNPFNPTTTIKFTIPTPPASSPLIKGRNEVGFVTLKVYDILGREVATLVNEEKPAGSYEILFNSSGLSSGIYFYQLKAGDFIQTKKFILMK